MIHQALWKDHFIVIDIETTGLKPDRDEIIEIAAMKMDCYGEIHTFQSLVRPTFNIPPFITQLTGIDDSMVKDAQPIQEVLRLLYHLIEREPVIGHNVQFDVRFLQYSLKKYLDIDWRPFTIDTLYLSRKLLPQLHHHQLHQVADYLSISSIHHHRALADVNMTLEIYLHFKNTYKNAP